MINKEISPLEQAEHELIESKRFWKAMKSPELQKLILVATVASLLYFYSDYTGKDSLPIHLVGAAIYFLANVADRYSTNKAFDAVNQVRENDIQTSYVETNPLNRGDTTAYQFNRNLKSYLADGATLAVSGFIPPVGVGVTCLKIIDTLNNLQIAKVHHRAIEIKHQNETAE